MILLLLHNCNFTTVMSCKVNIWHATPWKGPLAPKGVVTHRLRTTATQAHTQSSFSKNIIISMRKAGMGACVSFESPNRAFHYNLIQNTILFKSERCSLLQYNFQQTCWTGEGDGWCHCVVQCLPLQEAEHRFQAAVAPSFPFHHPPSFLLSPILNPFSLFETGSHYVDQAGLKLLEFHLPLSPQCWN